MGQISRAARLGRGAAALARAGSRMAGGKRTFGALGKGFSAFAKNVRGVAHGLFLEVTGVFFVLFVLIGVGATWREYVAWSAGKIGPGKLLLAICFTVLFLYFAVTSFWRSRRKQ
jgi:hypothetical protein